MFSYIYLLVFHLTCRGCGGTGTIVSVHNTLYANVLDQLGTKEQKDKFLVGFADGTHVGCFGISEPGTCRTSYKIALKKNWDIN
jgi:butyryl-CoA dehydrogenase